MNQVRNNSIFKITDSVFIWQGILTEREGSVHLTSMENLLLYRIIEIKAAVQYLLVQGGQWY
jgi:hypothetical protein